MGITNLILFVGGLGMFLYGIHIMGEGLELSAGSKLKTLLEKVTKNKFLAVLIGFLVTAIIQSSSATTVMVVGFVNAGLMNLTQAIGVIMGANIGTTMTSVLISLKLTTIAPVAIFIGVAMRMFGKKDIVKHVGEAIAGFGLLFFGMDTMSGAMKPLRDSEIFKNLITTMSNPLAGVLIGMVFTAIIQSSSASIGILQALAFQGLVPLNFALYVIYGQNIGTVITAMISSIGTKTNSKRTAVMHLLFNVIGTIVFLIITMVFPYAQLLERISDDIMVQISAAHIIFNVVSTVIMFPFSKYLVKLSCLLVPEKKEEVKEDQKYMEFVDDRMLSNPGLAVGQVAKEVARMAHIARNNFEAAANALIENDLSGVQKIDEMEEVINYLNHHITPFLVKINALELNYADAKFIGKMFHVVNDIERIGDHALNLAEAAESRQKDGVQLSEESLSELRMMSKTALALIDGSIAVFEQQELTQTEADRLDDLEETVDELREKYAASHIERLNKNTCTVQAGMLFINTITDFERVGDHAINIAWSVKNKPQAV